MAERLDQIFELHGDQRLVFDDENARRSLAIDFFDSFLNQGFHFTGFQSHDVGCLFHAEILERGKQQRLPVERRDGLQPATRHVVITRSSGAFAIRYFEIGAAPYLVESLVQRHAAAFERCLQFRIG